MNLKKTLIPTLALVLLTGLIWLQPQAEETKRQNALAPIDAQIQLTLNRTHDLSYLKMEQVR